MMYKDAIKIAAIAQFGGRLRLIFQLLLVMPLHHCKMFIPETLEQVNQFRVTLLKVRVISVVLIWRFPKIGVLLIIIHL